MSFQKIIDPNVSRGDIFKQFMSLGLGLESMLLSGAGYGNCPFVGPDLM